MVLHVDAYKQDGSWMRLQPLQTLLPLSAISVQTSAEAVVMSTTISMPFLVLLLQILARDWPADCSTRSTVAAKSSLAPLPSSCLFHICQEHR